MYLQHLTVCRDKNNNNKIKPWKFETDFGKKTPWSGYLSSCRDCVTFVSPMIEPNLPIIIFHHCSLISSNPIFLFVHSFTHSQYFSSPPPLESFCFPITFLLTAPLFRTVDFCCSLFSISHYPYPIANPFSRKMHFSNIVSAAIVAAPLVVSAATGNLGYAIGNRKPGTPLWLSRGTVQVLTFSLDGNCKYTADYEADFDLIKATYVRTYSSSECNTAEQILLAAAKKGVKVILGVWYVEVSALTLPSVQ